MTDKDREAMAAWEERKAKAIAAGVYSSKDIVWTENVNVEAFLLFTYLSCTSHPPYNTNTIPH